MRKDHLKVVLTTRYNTTPNHFERFIIDVILKKQFARFSELNPKSNGLIGSLEPKDIIKMNKIMRKAGITDERGHPLK